MAVAMDARWRSGEWVEVKTPEEILRTLDRGGKLDGIPFMPEMLAHCGGRFRVLRKAEKTCVELPGGAYGIREFQNNDAVLLDGLRCSGAAHDGCQRLCLLFWKEAWLRRVDSGQGSVSCGEICGGETCGGATRGAEAWAKRLPTRTDSGAYVCQSTELARATVAQPIGKIHLLRKCLRDVRSGAISPLAMVGLILYPLYRKTRDALVGRPVLRGSLTRTPAGDLGLEPGDWVQIKPLDEMRRTLDSRGRNRGLVCDIELQKFCGQTYRVRSRLDRMISETTGEMRTVGGTVILEGNTCMCARALGGCPRLDHTYWREVWLDRVRPGGVAHAIEPCVPAPAQAVGAPKGDRSAASHSVPRSIT